MGRNRFLCLDCQLDTGQANEYFMLRDDVWALTGLSSQDGMLCIGCIERRIGRRLERADFAAVKMNHPKVFPMSQRLLERIGVDGPIRAVHP
jgi:hypothetical protein